MCWFFDSLTVKSMYFFNETKQHLSSFKRNIGVKIFSRNGTISKEERIDMKSENNSLFSSPAISLNPTFYPISLHF